MVPYQALVAVACGVCCILLLLTESYGDGAKETKEVDKHNAPLLGIVFGVNLVLVVSHLIACGVVSDWKTWR